MALRIQSNRLANMNLKLIKIGGIILAVLISYLSPVTAGEKTENINICYEELSQAYTSLDANKMADVYVQDGYYISAGSRKGIIQGKPSLLKTYQSYFKRLTKHKSSVDLQFRVIDRLIDTASISDVGYYVVTIIAPKGSGQPAKQHVGKFMITFKRQDSGDWGIWSEANNKAKIQSYIDAKPQAGLHFDPYFPVSHYQENKQ